MSFRNKLKMSGLSSSLEDSPCISVCSTTHSKKNICICGRNVEQINSWNTYDTVTKKIIVMNAIKDKKYYPRQKLTFLADDHNISFEKAKKIFVTGKS
ncbi:MAG TPA: hypothetical protein DHV30_08150 [Balneola sp.]|nr:hypothetical protein [Balneola sp.]